MKNNRVNLIGGGILISIFIYSIFKGNNDIDDLKKNMGYTSGIVKETKIGKSNYFIIYSFNYKSKPYSKYKSIFGKNLDLTDKFLINKSFPVIISKEDPTNNALLIFKEDFERYNLPYPDSLRWVCDSLKLKDCN